MSRAFYVLAGLLYPYDSNVLGSVLLRQRSVGGTSHSTPVPILRLFLSRGLLTPFIYP